MTTHIVDKDFCLSSYLAYRYIYKANVDFYPHLHHHNLRPLPKQGRLRVRTAADIDQALQRQFTALYQQYSHIGILLSGGMDSAILATYLRPGSHAYTFTTTLSDVYRQDATRAQQYCQRLRLRPHLIDISFADYQIITPVVMYHKAAPVHSIEPQIYKAARAAQQNGDELIIIGESSDLIFGGMDQLLSQDWRFSDFIQRYTFLDPQLVLTHPVDVSALFAPYRLPDDKIDFLTFLDEVFAVESAGSYFNAFKTAQQPYYDPYARLIMADPLDLTRVRHGKSKYLIRDLYRLKYPDLPIPEKIPMPRPVDRIFEDWPGPTRPEFKSHLPLVSLTGNQKWQLWCAETFLNLEEGTRP